MGREVGGVEGNDQLAGRMKGVGVKVKGEVVDARPGTECGVGSPGAEMVEGELGEGEEVIPQVRGKVRVSGGEGGDEVVLRGADAPFSGEGAVNTGGNELDGEGNAAEVGAEGLGRFIVHDELGKGVSMGGENSTMEREEER